MNFAKVIFISIFIFVVALVAAKAESINGNVKLMINTTESSNTLSGNTDLNTTYQQGYLRLLVDMRNTDGTSNHKYRTISTMYSKPIADTLSWYGKVKYDSNTKLNINEQITIGAGLTDGIAVQGINLSYMVGIDNINRSNLDYETTNGVRLRAGFTATKAINPKTTIAVVGNVAQGNTVIGSTQDTKLSMKYHLTNDVFLDLTYAATRLSNRTNNIDTVLLDRSTLLYLGYRF